MERNTIVIDACLAITFGNAQLLKLLTGLRLHRVAIARRALDEVTGPPAKEQLELAISQGAILPEAVDLSVPAEQEALSRFDARGAFRGRGDAEVLALAVARGWLVGSDEVAVQRAAVDEIGVARVAGTLDFLRWAVAENRLHLEDALAVLQSLDVGLGLLRLIEARGEKLEDVLGP